MLNSFFGQTRRIGTTSAFFAVAACAAADLPDAGLATPNIASTYRRLTEITTGSIPVDPRLSTLCIGPQAPRDEKTYGPHAKAFSHRIFMNSLAASAFRERLASYPTGSVIVKEKFGQNAEGRPIGVGGMLKREPGYDPAYGDWEYFYNDLRYRRSTLETGRLETCRSCHASGSTRDHVFGTWARS